MNGVLNIFKPKGMTSFDVVREVKKVCKIKKVGHTGTLDPEATGVLPVCIGKATKIIDYIMDSEKIYEVTFKLGLKTTTYDLEGEILEERDSSFLKYEEILNTINSFKGEYCQVPPMYSALKQNGVRLYELARKGIEVERPGRNITIYNIEDIKIDNPYISMKVTCSKGTYIRSLCYDIGEKLGVYAAMTELCRVKTSRFLIENSVNINELTKDNLTQNLISIEEALNEFDKIVVNNKFAKLLVNGVNVFDSRVANEKLIANKLYRVYDENNNLLGIGSKNNNGFKIEKLLIT
ncbi:tRNA pseudouridine(55) synthase TruB [Clostridium sp. NSJ-145]|uniref:tRNA pseudouridine(55) synthase TruB n=1 Tax=Clostridium sp. NSJ-145 TaxID=2897777 RepID=UPI001E416CD8|nr:tRNA pseudouridine(55) synthase TruB [Clostridium sp. NSJ-145]MCD2501022.1 tRNA pseudouridine(55) synthase TruB [Clostridium sp. NSJ-145]